MTQYQLDVLELGHRAAGHLTTENALLRHPQNLAYTLWRQMDAARYHAWAGR